MSGTRVTIMRMLPAYLQRAPAAGEARLNALVRTEIRLMGKMRPAFQVCGGSGFILAVAAAITVAWRLELSALVTLALAAAGALTFFALAMAVKIVTGEERLI